MLFFSATIFPIRHLEQIHFEGTIEFWNTDFQTKRTTAEQPKHCFSDDKGGLLGG